MGAQQSNNSGATSTALVTSSDALQSNADPLSPAFKASPEMCRLIIAGGPPTAIQKRALGWLLYNWQSRGADAATSRLLRVSGLKARPRPEKHKWEEEELDAIDAALRMEFWLKPPPRGIKWGKVELRALQRMLSIRWRIFQRGCRRRVDPAQLKLEVLAAAALGFLGGKKGDVKALVMFERTTPKVGSRYGALYVGSRLALLRKQFLEDGSRRIGTIKSWSRHASKFVCLFDDGSEEKLGVSALFGKIVKSRSLEGGVVLCRKTEVDVLNWYKGEKRRLQRAASAASSFEPVSAAAISASAAAFDYERKVRGREALPRRSVEKESAASARATAASLLEVGTSLEAEIDEAITADPVKQARAEMKLSDWRLHGDKRTTGNSYIKGAKWNEEQGRTMERQGVKTLRDLALVNMDIRELALALTLSDDTKAGRNTARRTLWRRKGAAAALLGVKLGDKKSSGGGVAEPKEKKQRR